VFIGNNLGQLFAIADPAIAPAAGQRCSMPGVTNAACVASGFELVWNPKILATVPLTGGIRTEPVLAEGRVYVGTDGGHLYALEP
jgi:outer membrane protein assembly factor BamB